MSTHIMNPVRGKRIRITELDACGHPPTSGGTSIVSDGFITVTLTSLLSTKSFHAVAVAEVNELITVGMIGGLGGLN